MISRASLAPWLRRPVVLVAFCFVAVAALLSGGLVVAHAVDGTPVADASPSPAGGSSGSDNVAAGVNTQDGRTVYAFKLKIVQVSSDTVDATNAAVAANSGCTGCSTVSVAFEGVVVVGSPSTFTPTNLAFAANVDCSGCTAFADAYQQVVQTSTRVRVTKAGRLQIASIRKDLDNLRHEDLTLAQIVARVAADEQAFADVMLTDLVPVGHVTEPAPAGGADISDTPDAAPAAADPSPSGTTPGVGQVSPAAAPSPSDAASPSPSAAVSPSSSPTP